MTEPTEPSPPPGWEGSPFSPTGKVHSQAWQVTADEAIAAATAAGFRTTSRSRSNRVHVQRDWNTAATIAPTPGGVVVKPA